MKTKEEIKQWLLENCLDDFGNISLCELDFSDFDGNIIINGWNIKHSLNQSNHKVGENLYQGYHEVGECLFQDCQKVAGDLNQACQEVSVNLWQDCQRVGNDLYQSHQIVSNNLYQNKQICSARKRHYPLTRMEIRNWLLQHCVNEKGNLDLRGLDFSGFDGDILAGYWKVKGNLWQDNHIVEGSLHQNKQIVCEDIEQDFQKAGLNINQSHQTAGESIEQYNQQAEKIFQDTLEEENNEK